jgi:hypothetical protein
MQDSSNNIPPGLLTVTLEIYLNSSRVDKRPQNANCASFVGQFANLQLLEIWNQTTQSWVKI